MQYFFKASLHHATHSWLSHRHCGLLLRLVTDQTLGCEEHASNRSGVLKSHTLHLCRIYNTFLAKIFIDVFSSIVTKVTFTLANLLNHDSTFATSVLNDLTQRLFDGTNYDVDTSLLIGIVAF